MKSNINLLRFIRITLFISFGFTHTIFAQDLITFKDGLKIEAKVFEITMSEVKYKKYEHPDGPIYTLRIADIQEILYKNGFKDTFYLADMPARIDTSIEYVSPEYGNGFNTYNPCMQGTLEAQLYYTKAEQVGYATFCGTCALNPLFGLLVTLGAANTPIKQENLGLPNSKIRRNPEYMACYKSQAAKKKKAAAWKGYGLSAGLQVVALVGVMFLYFISI